ncbi:zinc finger BED domain-containing protein RICESLEEPER 4-like [Helianthus annuus]|uniref:zinc finger BED domain-containing protein RICESLEEPER 4-like n=1 Tax=Helianthus annuus TaxID=4232 RepID=UPI000B90A08C|nr:zinc finger BED domain-containing protein RICESLEEPER 4-like [Helianthus annuus]
MPPPHTGIALCEKVFSILLEWGIENKIFFVTLDNASSNDTFVGLLREQLNAKSPLVSKSNFFHLRCSAHILNLIVQDGLKEIDECVYKIRESIKYVKGSQQRKENFSDYVQLLSIKKKKGLRQDVVTRWNSTFLMLDAALYYRRAFYHLELSNSNFKHCPNALEWEKIRKIYFSLTLAIAVVLDPRYKLHFIDWSYSQIYGEASPEYSNVDQFLNSTFNEYVNMLNVASDDRRDDPTRALNASKEIEDTMDNSTHAYGMSASLKDFDQFQIKDFTINKKSELQMYLTESRVDRSCELDVLAFWKTNKFRYPALARMARDFLTIPVSTVASESTFSASGRVLNESSNQVSVDELIEDIMSLDISRESNASNSVNNPKV